MQADEQVRMVRLGKRDAVGQGHIRAIGPGQKRLAVCRQQGREAQRPIECEFLLKPPVQNAVRADVFAPPWPGSITMTRLPNVKGGPNSSG